MVETINFPRHISFRDAHAGEERAVEHASSPSYEVRRNASRGPGLEQVTASVYADSAAARQLFQGAGFKRRGVARQAAKVEGVYLDEEHYELRLACNLRHEVAAFEHAPAGDIWRGE